MADFSLTGLRVVQAVADCGSITAAAEMLGYTQSAVSRQVATMETAAGCALFQRESRGVVPTRAGTVVARRASTVLAELAATDRELTGLSSDLTGRVVVGGFPTAAAVLLPRTIARLLRAHPGLQVELREASTPANLRQVRAGRIDAAVIAVGGGLADENLERLAVRALHGQGMQLAVPTGHRLAGRTDVTASELVAESWIVREGLRSESHFGAWPTLTNPVVAYSASSLSARLGLVAAGLGIALIPSLAARSVPIGVEVVPVADYAWPGRQALVVARDEYGLATAVVLDELVACSADLSEG